MTNPPSRKSTDCDPQQLRLLVSDQLPDDIQSQVADHVAECSECQQILESMTGGAGWWLEVKSSLQAYVVDGGKLESDPALLESISGSHDPFTADFVVDFLEPSDQPDSLGRLGEYEILEVIGQGGMGIVLKGAQRELGRFVAVKVMSPHLATNGTARQRFVREARAAAAIVHPQVMPIHSVCTTSRLPYLVMPYVAGESLQQRLDNRGPLDLLQILRIGLQTAQALAASHAQGLVHRDVKPANILLEHGVDRVMLTDFGLARAADDASLTRTGLVAGTPQYMSPEQCCGENVDARSDLFSLGSVLYAMCVGRPPFRAETAMAVLRRISDTQPRSIREINPDIPAWLEEIVLTLHQKSPANRFQTATELAEILEQCLAHVQQPTVYPLPVMVHRQPDQKPTPISRRFWISSAIVIVLVLICIGLIAGTNALLALRKARDATLVADAHFPSKPSVTEKDIVQGAAANPQKISTIPHTESAGQDANRLAMQGEWNFQGSLPNFLFQWGSRSEGSELVVPDGLKLSRAPDATEADCAVGFEVAGDLSSDFEITLDYRNFKSVATSTDWRVPRVDISGQIFSDDDPVNPMHVLGVAHRRTVDGAMRLTATQGDKEADGTMSWRSSTQPIDRDSGRLRLSRQGNQILYQGAPLRSDDWVTINTRNVDPGVFKLIVIGLRAEDLQGSGEAVLSNLTIRATKFQKR